jgi:anti-sigma B factor antagonist
MTLKKVKGNGGQLVLAGLNTSVRQIFDLAGFSTMFAIEPDVDRAVVRATGAGGGA